MFNMQSMQVNASEYSVKIHIFYKCKSMPAKLAMPFLRNLSSDQTTEHTLNLKPDSENRIGPKDTVNGNSC